MSSIRSILKELQFKDIERPGIRGKNLEQALKDISELIIKTDYKMLEKMFMYETIYGEIDDNYKGVDVLNSFKEYNDKEKLREDFATFVENKVKELLK